MKKFLGASVVLVLVVGLPSVTFFRNDPASLRAVIEEEASKEAGVGLDIQGEMRWKWMPFGLEARDVSIRLPGPGGERSMHAEAMIFEADPAELVWNGLRFSGLDHIKAISLKALEGRIASGTREEDAGVVLKQADIRIERVAFEQPMRVRGRYQVESTAGWFAGQYALSASLWVEQGFERLEMRDVQLQGTPASNSPLAFLGRHDLNIEHLVWIDGLPVSLETIRGDWELGVSMSSERVEAGFAVNHGDRPMTALEKELGFRFEALADGQSPRFRVNGDMQVHVDRMDLLMQSTGWMSDAYDYSRFPRKVDANFGLSLFEGMTRIESLSMVSGEDRLVGSLTWQPSSTRALTFDLGIQHLDLMRWIPGGAPDLVPDGQASERLDDAVVPDESVSWHALGGRGVVRAAHIRVGETVFSEASALVEIEKSVLEMKGAHARIDEAGVLEMDVNIDLKGNASGALALVSRSAPVLPYLKILGLDQELHGQGDLEARLFVQGLDRVSWRRSLRGDVSVRLPEGALTGLNPVAQICQAVSFVENGHASASGTVREPVPFTDLEAGFAFSQGVSAGSSVSFMTDNAQTMGTGDVDLLQKKYAWQLGIRHRPPDETDPVGVADSEEVAESTVCDLDARYASLSWPMTCQGDFGPENMAACGFDQVVLDDRRAAVLEGRKVEAEALARAAQTELLEKADSDTAVTSAKVQQTVATLPVASPRPVKPAVRERPAPRPAASSAPTQPAAPPPAAAKTVQVKKTVQGYEVNGKVFPSRAAASEEARWERFRQKFREGKHR
jgi:hypothetical protein